MHDDETKKVTKEHENNSKTSENSQALPFNSDGSDTSFSLHV